MGPPELRILMSDRAHACVADRLDVCLAGRPWRRLPIEQLADGPVGEVDIAFISRDVTGQSTKHVLSESLARCYDALRAARQLRWVHIHSAGADRPVFGELMRRGVAVTTSSGANARVVAHTAIAGVLALARRLPQLLQAQRERRWSPLIGGDLPRDLDGQTAVLVGWGPIGQEIARVLAALRVRVVVVRRGAAPAAGVERTVDAARLLEVLPGADWLILACPLTDATRGLIGQQALGALPAGCHLVNVARGEVVDEPALIAALAEGRLAGAFLDVFAHEPLPAESPLWSLPQVIVTPHAAGHSDGHYARVAQMFLDNLQRWLAGEPLAHAAR